MTIFTPSSSSDSDDLFPPSFIPSLVSSLAKICPVLTAHGEANVNTAGESGGRGARDRHGDKDGDRHGHMHMYEYTHMHNPRKGKRKCAPKPAHKHKATVEHEVHTHLRKAARMSAVTHMSVTVPAECDGGNV